MLRQLQDITWGNDFNYVCYGYDMVDNYDDKNVPSGETHAMPGGNPMTVSRVKGMLNMKLVTNVSNGGRVGGNP